MPIQASDLLGERAEARLNAASGSRTVHVTYNRMSMSRLRKETAAQGNRGRYWAAGSLGRGKGRNDPGMTPREKNRLRCERWRRAHGIGPRKPAKRPWLALGVSRSTQYYRRRAKARSEAALTRAEAFTRQLQAELAEVARCQAITAAIIAELALANP